MDFDNQSGLQAALLRGGLPEPGGRTLAVVVAKACAVCGADGQLEFDPDVPAPVCFEPVQHRFGLIPADVAIRKHGMDVLALGKAYHPHLDGGPESRVSVRVGRQERQLSIFGERVWYKAHDGRWAISDPQPFSLMDLTWEHSFGGTSFDEWGNDLPHPLNREGKGYIAHEVAVDGTALPNIEDPTSAIRSWQDQPRPCNIAPAPKHVAFDPTPYLPEIERALEQPLHLPAEFWNDAVPQFRFADVQPGAELRLTGMSEVPMLGHVPSFRLLANVDVGGRTNGFELVPDTVMFFPEARCAVFAWRASFTYEFVPRELRRVTLRRVG